MHLLHAGSMIDATLNNTATVAVSTNCDAVLSDGIKDELRVLTGEPVETLLDDVVAVEILNHRNNLACQCVDDDLFLLTSITIQRKSACATYLLLRVDVVDHLLQSPSTMLVRGNLDHERCGVGHEYSALFIGGMFEQFLTKVVAKGVCKC